MRFSDSYLGKLRKIVGTRLILIPGARIGGQGLTPLGRWVWLVLFLEMAFAVKPSLALPPNACVPLFDPNYDRASETYVNVNISDDRSACFLLPRGAIRSELRDFNSQQSVMLEPAGLLRQLNGKTSIRVGREERNIDQSLIDCLSTPMPDVIMITHGPPFLSQNLVSLRSRHIAAGLSPPELVISDLSGYRRFTRVGPRHREDFYFADPGPEAPLSFWCGDYSVPEACMIEGEYDGMKAGIGYPKSQMERVRPGEALKCIRLIGDLFRLDNEKL